VHELLQFNKSRMHQQPNIDQNLIADLLYG